MREGEAKEDGGREMKGGKGEETFTHCVEAVEDTGEVCIGDTIGEDEECL